MPNEYTKPGSTAVDVTHINMAEADLAAGVPLCKLGIANDTNSIVFKDKDGNVYALRPYQIEDTITGATKVACTTNLVAVTVGSSEKARFDATGFGIGTDAPQQPLDVIGTSQIRDATLPVLKLKSTASAPTSSDIGKIQFFAEGETAGSSVQYAELVGGCESIPGGGDLAYGYMQFRVNNNNGLEDILRLEGNATSVTVHVGTAGDLLNEATLYVHGQTNVYGEFTIDSLLPTQKFNFSGTSAENADIGTTSYVDNGATEYAKVVVESTDLPVAETSLGAGSYTISVLAKDGIKNGLVISGTDDSVNVDIGSNVCGTGVIRLQTQVEVNGVLNLKNDIFTDGNYIYTSAGTLNYDYDGNAPSGFSINYTGYRGGTNHFRDLVIFNGKNQEITRFVGETKQTKLFGELHIEAVSSDIYTYNNGINCGYNSNAADAFTINDHGYLGLNTQPRDLYIQNGQEESIAWFQGSTKQTTLYGALITYGAIALSSGYTTAESGTATAGASTNVKIFGQSVVLNDESSLAVVTIPAQNTFVHGTITAHLNACSTWISTDFIATIGVLTLRNNVGFYVGNPADGDIGLYIDVNDNLIIKNREGTEMFVSYQYTKHLDYRGV